LARLKSLRVESHKWWALALPASILTRAEEIVANTPSYHATGTIMAAKRFMGQDPGD